jgi:hypothetical protein
MKHCYIRLSEDFSVLYNDRFAEVMLVPNDLGVPMCHLSGPDDWELSYTGPDAEDKFNALLDVSGEVTYDYILQLGFYQYG